MVPEGQSHWHDGVSRVANDIVETDEETGRRLIARGVVAEVEAEPRPMEEETPEVVTAPKVYVAEPERIDPPQVSLAIPVEVAPQVIKTDLVSDPDITEESETERVTVVDSDISLTDFPKVE